MMKKIVLAAALFVGLTGAYDFGDEFFSKFPSFN